MTLSFQPYYRFRRIILSFLLIAAWGIPFISAKQYTLDEQQNINIYKNKGPGVVNITSITLNYDFFLRPVPAESGSGSGFIIDDQGHILTNYHVVEGARKLTVTLSDNTQWPAGITGIDPSNDLAVIKLEKYAGKLTILELGDSSEIVVGQKVLALGNPFGLKQTLTTGIISALGRTIEAQNGRKIEGVIQSDAAINPGNSGGPLLDTEGKAIGINTAIIGSGNVGIGFSVPSNTARRIVPDLIAYGYVRRPWLGVESIPTSNLKRLGLDIPDGMLVTALVERAPAHLAGLRGAQRDVHVGNYRIPWGGDIITSIDGTPVRGFEELADKIESYAPGDTITVRYIRNDRPHSISVKLQQRPRPR
ncbi:MAG: trypsin-like peptidase domain-containing protein [SAR324 cluster bacterium]|nr:trypsin-like peptidase domain-containing protein [SAR324 cluster bacterium]